MKKETPELVRISTKGQLVIPKDIRKDLHLKKGSIMLIAKRDSILVIKKVETKIQKEEIRLAEEVKKAWEEIERGEYKKSSKDEFLKELDKW